MDKLYCLKDYSEYQLGLELSFEACQGAVDCLEIGQIESEMQWKELQLVIEQISFSLKTVTVQYTVEPEYVLDKEFAIVPIIGNLQQTLNIKLTQGIL